MRICVYTQISHSHTHTLTTLSSTGEKQASNVMHFSLPWSYWPMCGIARMVINIVIIRLRLETAPKQTSQNFTKLAVELIVEFSQQAKDVLWSRRASSNNSFYFERCDLISAIHRLSSTVATSRHAHSTRAGIAFVYKSNNERLSMFAWQWNGKHKLWVECTQDRWESIAKQTTDGKILIHFNLIFTLILLLLQ